MEGSRELSLWYSSHFVPAPSSGEPSQSTGDPVPPQDYQSILEYIIIGTKIDFLFLIGMTHRCV